MININGTYGADGTKYRMGIDQFSKIISYGKQDGGLARFKIWTKSGLIMEFGYRGDSRIEAAKEAYVRELAVNKITNRSGVSKDFFTMKKVQPVNIIPLKLIMPEMRFNLNMKTEMKKK